jgi:hypothetical protein
VIYALTVYAERSCATSEVRTSEREEQEMELGKPQRIYTIEPVQSPVPQPVTKEQDDAPAKRPVEAPKSRP